MKWFVGIFLAGASAMLLGLQGCGSEGRLEASPRAAFSERGVLQIQVPRDTRRIDIRDEHGVLLANAYPHGRTIAEALFEWKPGERYRVVTDRGGETVVQAPARLPVLAVRLHAPLGQSPREIFVFEPGEEREAERIFLPVESGERLDLMVEVEQLRDGPPISVWAQMEAGRDWLLHPLRSLPQGSTAGEEIEAETAFYLRGARQTAKETLAGEFDKQVWLGGVEAGDALPEAELALEVAGEDFRVPFVLQGIRSQLRDEIEVLSWDLPTDSAGRIRPDQPRNQIGMPNPLWDRLGATLGLRPQAINFLEAYTHQTLILRNSAPHSVSLAVVARVVDARTGAPVGFFDPPRWTPAGGADQVAAFVEIGPGETRSCTLPLYVEADTTAGTYLRKAAIQVLGSDKILTELDAPLQIIRSRPFLTVWVFLVVLVSGGWLGAMAVFYRRLVSGLGTRVLTLLSLLGALQFCLGLVGGWISNLFYAVLGPFNCLVGGFLTEVLNYLLVAAILCLVPRPGAMSLAGIVTYLMGAILFGTLGLTDLLFVGSALAFREILLYLFGVTRRRKTDSDVPRLLPMMLALGLADAAATFTSLSLFAIFFRLFYANWYIALNVVVTGFLYTCVGTWLGRNLGQGLRKVRP